MTRDERQAVLEYVARLADRDRPGSSTLDYAAVLERFTPAKEHEVAQERTLAQ